MNFFYDPVSAAQVAACVQLHLTGRRCRRQSSTKLDASLAEDPLLFPTTQRSRRPRRSHSFPTTSRPSSTPRSPRSPAPDAMSAADDDDCNGAPGGEAPEMLGLGALLLAGALLAAVGTRLLTGPIAVLSLAIVFASIVDARGRRHDRHTRDPAQSRRTGCSARDALADPVLPCAAAHAPASVVVDTAEPVRRRRRVRLELRQLRHCVHRLRTAVPALVPLRRHRHDPLHRDRLPARVRDRVPRRRVQEPAARARRHPVLHDVPDPHDRLEDDPRRRGHRHRIHRCRRAHVVPRRPMSWTTGCSRHPAR